VDNTEGAAIATRHLLGLGHHTSPRRGPTSWLDAQERAAAGGWRLTGGVAYLTPGGDWSSALGYEIATGSPRTTM